MTFGMLASAQGVGLALKRAGIWLVLISLSFGAAATEARQLTDELGRAVELPDEPKRIVSLAPSITETLFALGLEARIVGVTDYCQYPEAAKQKAKVGGIINPNLERIVSLKPDLLVVTTEANNSEILAPMNRFGIPVFAISPRSLDGVLASIALLGEATGSQAQAKALVEELTRRRLAIAHKVKNRARPRVLILYDLHPIVAGGKNAFPTALIREAGGVSVTGELEQDWPRLNIEYIVKEDPEVIFVSQMPSIRRQVEALKSLSGWKMTSAVKNNRIYVVDDRINQPGPRLVEALEVLAEQIHPDAFDAP
ncbi:MAG: cobalamin-binding protein [Acidobacteriota bacterium]